MIFFFFFALYAITFLNQYILPIVFASAYYIRNIIIYFNPQDQHLITFILIIKQITRCEYNLVIIDLINLIIYYYYSFFLKN